MTGGEGFIGRHLRDILIREGHSVTTMDIAGDPDLRISVTDFHALMGIDGHFDGIFHLAGVTSPPQFEDDPLWGFQVNANGTLNVMEFARRKGIRRVVFASSSATYGDLHERAEEHVLPERYTNMYPITKVTGEHLARCYSARGEVECISLRYFNTFGPGENSKGAYASPIARFVESAKRSDPIIVYGDGTQSRDFIYVKDTARATLLAFLHGKPGESYNIGTGITTKFNEIARIVIELTGSRSEIVHVPNPLKTYQMFTLADITKTGRDLHFKPEYDLRRAIAEMIA
ncbi:NAD-dependent epimerase/dehydratase family protein [Thermoplasmatales archaeon AK]|nr:NAD-dependent epimerase/dehydratase family protein [Thermoplasmatales archaeon AK]